MCSLSVCPNDYVADTAVANTSQRRTFSACPLVRGKPSKMNPYLHSGFSSFCSISLHTTSSLTSFPASIVALSSFPNSEPEATSARSKSPGNHRQFLNEYQNLTGGQVAREVLVSKCRGLRSLSRSWRSDEDSTDSTSQCLGRPRRLGCCWGGLLLLGDSHG